MFVFARGQIQRGTDGWLAQAYFICFPMGAPSPSEQVEGAIRALGGIILEADVSGECPTPELFRPLVCGRVLGPIYQYVVGLPVNEYVRVMIDAHAGLVTMGGIGLNGQAVLVEFPLASGLLPRVREPAAIH